MTIRLEIEWTAANLLATAKHLLSTKDADRLLDKSWNVVESPEAAAEFLLGKLKDALERPAATLDFSNHASDAFPLYKSVWVAFTVFGGIQHAGDDRLTGGPARGVREHGALQRKDAGVLVSRILDLPSDETRVLLAKVKFLALLEER